MTGQLQTNPEPQTGPRIETGQRSFGRLNFWWFPKVGPALALAYCAALVFHVPGWITLRSVLVVAFVGLCAGLYGYLLNDIFDIEVDRRAGKANGMAAFSPGQHFLFCVLAVALGFAPFLFVPASKTTLLMLGIEYLILTVYSVPPIRLKSRGVFGLLCDASGAHLGASLFVVAVLADGRTSASSGPKPGVFLAVLLAWQLCLGLIGILVHQVGDRDNDIRSGIQTFATAHSFAQIRIPMSCVFAGEILAFTTFCILLLGVAPLLSIATLLYAALLALRLWSRWPHFRNTADQGILMEWWQLSHPFYESYFPLATAIQCAWIHPQIALLVPLHLAVFVAVFRTQAAELRGAWTRLTLGTRLNVAGTAAASLRPVLVPRLARRIDIANAGTMPWEICAARSGIALQSSLEYSIQITLRAGQPRTVTIGVWQDHAPWNDLGLVERIPLSNSWQTVSRQFTAADDELYAYLGVWLGGEAGSIEIQNWSVTPLASHLQQVAKDPGHE